MDASFLPLRDFAELAHATHCRDLSAGAATAFTSSPVGLFRSPHFSREAAQHCPEKEIDVIHTILGCVTAPFDA